MFHRHLLYVFVATALPIAACGDPAPSEPTCRNGVLDPGETGIDCGGDCKACETADPCANGRRDGDETGVDCGGACAAACASGCDNGVQDGAEEGVDCGGACAACPTSGSCTDGVRNQNESDVDCGGVCDTCATGKGCNRGPDCQTSICTDGLCAAPALTCTDGAKSGDETDVDCGGSCSPCGFGGACLDGDDCGSGVCSNGTCADPTCTDGVANGFESDVDCGPGCDACGAGKRCGFNPDCASGACDGGRCVSCDDGTRNGTETDVDCGGSVCGKCDDGETCSGGSDCRSGGCEGGRCAGCASGRKDGDETDVDCGGSCGPCASGEMCQDSGDCDNVTCDGGRCATPSCTDRTANGQESDVDCGGTCDPCARGELCHTHDDCGAGDYCPATAGARCTAASFGAVALGYGHTCAITTERGTVRCWGSNARGQLGVGDTTDRLVPTLVPGLSDVVDIAAGAAHTCAVTSNNAVYCWGSKDDGAVGLEAELGTTTEWDQMTPARVNGLSATRVGAGYSHTCVLTTGGGVKCFGRNWDGQLGNGATDSGNWMPVDASGLTSGVMSLAVGAHANCALKAGGVPHCWGDNHRRALMDSELSSINVPTALDTSGWNRVTMGTRIVCLQNASGRVECWGSDAGSNSDRQVVEASGARDVSCGYYACHSVSASGTLKTFAAISSQSALRRAMSAAGLSATRIIASATQDYACYIGGSGVLSCAGHNYHDQLGLGAGAADEVDSFQPVAGYGQ